MTGTWPRCATSSAAACASTSTWASCSAPASPAQVLSRIIPSRIGHGVLLLDDAQTVQLIREHGICLDMCPVSNTRLGVWDWTRSSPAAMAMHLGLPVTINTDDPVLFGAGLAANLALAGLSSRQLDDRTAAPANKYGYQPMTPGMTLHVIYGIACAGKSTTALRYAGDNGIRTVISTDYLREVQRLYVPADRVPGAGEGLAHRLGTDRRPHAGRHHRRVHQPRRGGLPRRCRPSP